MRSLNLNLVPFVEYCQHFIFEKINHSSLVILGCFEVVNVWCTVMQQPTMVGNRSAPKLSFSQPTTVVKPVSQLVFENIFGGAHQFRVNPCPNTLLSVNQPLSVNFSFWIFALKGTGRTLVFPLSKYAFFPSQPTTAVVKPVNQLLFQDFRLLSTGLTLVSHLSQSDCFFSSIFFLQLDTGLTIVDHSLWCSQGWK